MAEDKEQPQFLGGGPKFNRAGAQPPAAEVTAVPEVPPPSRSRTPLIVVMLLVLIGILYAVIVGPSGLSPTPKSRQGISPTQHTVGPDSDTGP